MDGHSNVGPNDRWLKTDGQNTDGQKTDGQNTHGQSYY